MTENNGVPAPGLTRDNTHLSRPKLSLHGSTVDCTDLPQAVARYVRDSSPKILAARTKAICGILSCGAARSLRPLKVSPLILRLTPTASMQPTCLPSPQQSRGFTRQFLKPCAGAFLAK